MATTSAERQRAYRERARRGEGDSLGAKLTRFDARVRDGAPVSHILEAAADLVRRDGEVLPFVARNVCDLVAVRDADGLMGMSRLAFGPDEIFIRAWAAYLVGPAWGAAPDQIRLLARLADAGAMPPDGQGELPL